MYRGSTRGVPGFFPKRDGASPNPRLRLPTALDYEPSAPGERRPPHMLSGSRMRKMNIQHQHVLVRLPK